MITAADPLGLPTQIPTAAAVTQSQRERQIAIAAEFLLLTLIQQRQIQIFRRFGRQRLRFKIVYQTVTPDE